MYSPSSNHTRDTDAIQFLKDGSPPGDAEDPPSDEYNVPTEPDSEDDHVHLGKRCASRNPPNSQYVIYYQPHPLTAHLPVGHSNARGCQTHSPGQTLRTQIQLALHSNQITVNASPACTRVEPL